MPQWLLRTALAFAGLYYWFVLIARYLLKEAYAINYCISLTFVCMNTLCDIFINRK